MRGSMEAPAAGGATDTAPVATIVIPSALAGYAGGRSHIGILLGEPAGGPDEPKGPHAALTSVLDRLAREVPALERRIRDERGRVRGHVNIYVDGVDIRELGGVDTMIVPGATVQIIAAVSGG